MLIFHNWMTIQTTGGLLVELLKYIIGKYSP